MTIGAIIQARLTSTRFPRKILETMSGVTVLEQVVRRVWSCDLIDELVIAAPHSPECCLNENIFIGSEHDVLDRYYQAAKKYRLDIIVRITSDCPLVPPNEIKRVVNRLLERDTHYVRNFPNVPDGWDVEAMTFQALKEAWEKATDLSDREHVTPYMKRNEEMNPLLLPPPKLSLDTREDLERIREFYESERENYIGHRRNREFCNELYPVSSTALDAQSHTGVFKG